MASEDKISEYAAALSALLKTTPLEKIRVNDICKQCGTDRQNFYYYFKDKYDLAAWIYKLDYIEVLGNNSNLYSEKRLAEMMEKMLSKSEIYKNLFKKASQNSLYSFMMESEYQIILQMKKEKTGTARLSSEEKFDMIFNQAAFFEVLIAWIRGEYSVSISEFVEWLFRSASDYINKYYENSEFKKFPKGY